ncbi:MAG: RraA family protein, partial [Chloroflexi bacterium]|nr:RraA family protein [Chloroflexota bacterium]
TLVNAIETFGVIPPNSGFSDGRLICHYPDLPTMVGCAVTLRISTDQPPSQAHPGVPEMDYWRYVEASPGPKVAIVQDIDSPPKGGLWGEWNSNMHAALGCVGMVTEGAARNIDAVRKLKLHFFRPAFCLRTAMEHL